ncbi:MAG: xanthine dehydrogenase small subunit [Calditrichaceae bacterium]|nr:xanthine dehydrogenase small subunit [Calditrichaceae bacterium]HES60133.1 xanthine dehydrogenase small subunit [Caldithrix sp.]
MNSCIGFILDEKLIEIDFSKERKFTPTTTVLNYLRDLPNHKGVKEGCAEGDCGACTIVIAELDGRNGLQYRAVNSCLIFLPKLHGKWLITVENIKNPDGSLHPVQQAMVDYHGSQCGFCTPGFIMSMFALYKSNLPNTRAVIEDALTGNLCRCTGYQPIIEAAEFALQDRKPDHFSKIEKEIIAILKKIVLKSMQMATDRQKYFMPVSVTELLYIKNQNPDAIIINGASDIALRVTKKYELIPSIIDTMQIEELHVIRKSIDHLYCGSAITLNQLMEVSREWYPAIYEACSVFGSKQIREMATIGGNLGTASPIGDLPPVLAAYKTDVVVVSEKGARIIPVDEFICGYRKTSLKKGEIIKGIKIPKPMDGTIIKFYKVSKRKDLDISTVSAAFRLTPDKEKKINEIKIIFGGMAEMTKHAVKTEKFLKGKSRTRETIEQAMPILEEEFTPISDARSSAQFRSVIAKNLLLRFFDDLADT